MNEKKADWLRRKRLKIRFSKSVIDATDVGQCDLAELDVMWPSVYMYRVIDLHFI